MINLLPDMQKSQIFFARRNTALRKWVIASLLGVAGIVLIYAVGFVFINHLADNEKAQVSARQQQLKDQNLDATQKRVAEISDSIKLATNVLSKQVLFSKLLTKVGATMPAGTSLQSLSINSLEGGIDLIAVATTYQTATQVQVNLADPQNKIFEKADIVSVSCNQDPTTPTEYPCQVTIRALFAKENAFQVVSQKGSN